MPAVFLEDQVEVRSENDTGDALRPAELNLPVAGKEIAVELGIWLSGLDSFLASGHHSFADSRENKASLDASKEFRLVHSTLQRCSMLNARILSSICIGESDGPTIQAISEIEHRNLALVLREVMLLSDALIHSDSLSSGEWKAWSNLLSLRLESAPAFLRLISFAEEVGATYLPESLLELASSTKGLNQDQSEIAVILPRFGVILKWLSLVGKMLDADEPLKPALLIFSRINEQIFELTSYINNRLERFPDEEAELFSSLDAASYTASIELKKVYSQELAGLARMRPAPSIFARMETSHSLLNEGFQQMLAGFARILDTETDIFKLFPTFHIKLEQSIALRQELRDLVQLVYLAEVNPDKIQIDKLHAELREFMNGSVKFLFFKDTETVERFVEEILVTRQNKDLVPILHRFGAYLETLFGQVKLRAVLEKYPLESEQA